MSTSLLYHGFGLRGVKYQATQYVGNRIVTKAEVGADIKFCSSCSSRNIIFKGRKRRFFHIVNRHAIMTHLWG